MDAAKHGLPSKAPIGSTSVIQLRSDVAFGVDGKRIQSASSWKISSSFWKRNQRASGGYVVKMVSEPFLRSNYIFTIRFLVGRIKLDVIHYSGSG